MILIHEFLDSIALHANHLPTVKQETTSEQKNHGKILTECIALQATARKGWLKLSYTIYTNDKSNSVFFEKYNRTLYLILTMLFNFQSNIS